MKFGAGRHLLRREDDKLVTGAGRFVADIEAEGALHLVLLRSPYAHATIARIDVSSAVACPGVVAVITGADLAAEGIGAMPSLRHYDAPDGGAMRAPPRHLLARDVVRHIGEPIAAVVARSQQEAEAALEAIDVTLTSLDAVVGLDAATAEGAPLLWPEAG